MARLEAFREDLVALLPRLRRFARVMARDPADADDLVQLAVERALLRWQQWQPGSRLDSWMFGIVRNAWFDELRVRHRRSRTFADEHEGVEVGETSAAQQQERMAINQAMARLPEEQRLAVALVLVEGLSYQEAADALGIPVGTLTSRLARGRMVLMKDLADGAPGVAR